MANVVRCGAVATAVGTAVWTAVQTAVGTVVVTAVVTASPCDGDGRGGRSRER